MVGNRQFEFETVVDESADGNFSFVTKEVNAKKMVHLPNIFCSYSPVPVYTCVWKYVILVSLREESHLWWRFSIGGSNQRQELWLSVPNVSS